MKMIKLLIAWTWITLPLGWGVYKSVQKSLPLFEAKMAVAVPQP